MQAMAATTTHGEHMQSPDTPSAGALLAAAEFRTRAGKYYDALGILERTMDDAHGDHSEHWMGMVCAAAARNKLHIQDDQGARQYLNLISPALRAANPKIDAECHTISGILRRREAYTHWKAGREHEALALADDAIEAFRHAEHSAQMALEDRLQHNAVLNCLYAEGLKLAIQARPCAHYAPLLAAAIVAEAASRDSTPPCVRDELSGLIIVIDLACGAGASLDDAARLSEESAFVKAAGKILRAGCSTWAELILSHVRDMNICKSDVLARAMLLGCKLLREDGYRADRALLAEYAARLRIHCLDLDDAASNAALRRQIMDALAHFPAEIAQKVMRLRFLR
jgi:hypothetical protein